MKKRSEIIAERAAKKQPSASQRMRDASTSMKYNNLFCSLCGNAQWTARDGTGITCSNGHNGASGIESDNADLETVREYWADQRAKTIEMPKKKNVSSQPDKKKIEDLSGQLRDILQPPEQPFNFPSAHKKSKKTRLRGDLEQIITKTFIVDLSETWDQLEKELQIGEKRSDHATLQKGLDKAETNAFNAHRLYVTALIESKRWEKENSIIIGGMISAANLSLQQEKDQGIRNKAITDQDIRARCATLFADEYVAQEVKKAEVDAVIESLKDLAEQWKSRCRTLGVMMSKLR